MGSVFLLLIFSYVCCFLYKTFGGNTNISDYLSNIEKFLSYVYNNILNFTRARASNLILAQRSLKKNIKKLEKKISVLKIRNYLAIATVMHVIGFYIINHFIVIRSPIIKQNWQYAQDLSEEESTPVEFSEAPPEYDSVPYAEENTEDNGKLGDNTESLDLPKLHTELLPQAYNVVVTPVIHKSSPKNTKVAFATINNKNGGGIGGLGSNGQGKGLFGKGFGGKGSKEGKIMGDKIKADRLGVILDTSNSMGPFIPVLEQEIRNNFSNAQVTYANGCQITEFSEVIFAFKYLAQKDVDVIYWFCDLQDRQTHEGLNLLNRTLKEKNIKLYIKSMDKQPNSKLSSVISSSGGKFLTKSN